MRIKRLYTTPPPVGEPLEIAPGILWLRLPLPFRLDHINVWLLEEKDQYTLVDCGICRPEVETIWESFNQTLFSQKPLRRIVVTHAHPDHIGMAGPLSRQHLAPVYMSSSEYLAARALSAALPGFDSQALTTFLASHGLAHDTQAEETRKARGNLFAEMVPTPPLKYQRLQHGDTLQIGQYTWKCHTGYGHSPEHISLICDEQQLMISGDMLLPTISTNVSVYASEPEGNPLKAFLQSVQDMAQLPDTLTVLPSHGVPFTGVKTRCAQLIAHHESRLDELRYALIEKPLSARQILNVLFPRELDGHQTSFAMGEAIAHLHYLWKAGQLERLQEQGIWKFHATPNHVKTPTGI